MENAVDDATQQYGSGEDSEKLNLYGQVLTPKEIFLKLFRHAAAIDDLVPLLRLEDNFTAVYERGETVWIVSSLYSMNAYFYTLGKNTFLHSDTICGITKKGKIDLSWNFEAIADLMGLGHLVGEDTLARNVRSLPMGTILCWDGNQLRQKSFHHEDFFSLPAGRSSPELLVDLVVKGLTAGIGDKPILTASAGLDSRVNLAGVLNLGLKPELLVMGQESSKDVQVVKILGKEFGLRVNHVILETRDYLDNALEICRLTSGAKPLNHWHSYILGAKAGYRNDTHVVTGTNGEHVRAMGFDYGALALALDHLSVHDGHAVTGRILSGFWKMRTHILLGSEEIANCNPEFARYYGTRRQNRKFMSLMPDKSFVWQSDAFILQQRRRGFQACGLKLYGANFWPYSSYLRKSWIDAGWQLSLPWRLGSRWHRFAVERLYPQLLEFPEEKETSKMLRRPRPLYWLGGLFRRLTGIKTPGIVPYVDYRSLMQRREIVGLLHDYSSELDDFMPRRVLDEIMARQLRDGSRGALFATLTGMATWRASLR